MKKTILLLSFLGSSALAFAQQQVKQYFYTAGGNYGDPNNKVKIAVTDGKTDKSIDAVKGDFSNAVKVYRDKTNQRTEGIAHVGRSNGKDLIVRYDLDTYARLDSTGSSGVAAFARNQNKLVVAKGYGSSGAKVDILNANTLEFISGIAEINNDCADVEIFGDSAFVAYSSKSIKNACAQYGYTCYDDSLGFVAVIDLRQNKLVNTIALGADAKGLKNLIIRKEADSKLHIYYSNFGKGQLEFQDNLVFHSIKESQTVAVTNDFIFGIQKTNPMLTAIDIDKFSNDTTLHATQVAKGFESCEYDTVNNLYLILKTDYFSYGKLIRYSVAENKAIDTVDIGISSTALDIDYRPGTILALAKEESSSTFATLYPNPCKDIVTLNNQNHFTSWKIKSPLGHTFATGTMEDMEEQINVESLEKGVHFMVLRGSGSQKTIKFVKE